MVKKLFCISLSLFFACFFLVSCSRDEVEHESFEKIKIIGEDWPKTVVSQGNIRIKVSESFAENLEHQTDKEGNVITANVRSMNNAISSMGIVRMERTFPYAGEFEERTRREGLHLWYDIYFNKTRSVSKAADDLKMIEGIDEIEYVPVIVPIDYKITRVFDDDDNIDITTASKDMPFDDPRLNRQWHYYNDGSFPTGKAKAGCDINVLPVWKMGITGNPDVIVSVVDGGVDFGHEDLKDNMWHNPKRTGNEVYGFNFVNNSWIVTPDEHGTHVAGTIAAVNNNGKGVCGIAGGDYANGIQGVKIMSCQIFQGEESASGAKAIKWGADHGAVISQNSWGYEKEVTSLPSSDKAAIDYFIKKAGCDDNGNQLPNSPMKGGIVIFAAGNNSKDISYPAKYEKVFSVASVGPDFKRAYYSNYGDWVDISAPGGDQQKAGNSGGILSTLSNNRYGYMQGTSMACPHVSGVAALVVSKCGGPGFTNTALWEKLQSFPTSINSYNPNVKMGAGLINSFSAVMSGEGEAPDAITDLSVAANSNIVTFGMTIPRDEDSEKPTIINIYYGKTKINKNNVYSMECITLNVDDLAVGDRLEGSVSSLEFTTKYYFAAVAVDATNNHSDLSNVVNVTTGANNPPVIVPADPIVATVKKYESLQLKLFVYDPDGHKISSKIEPVLPGFRSSITDSLIININGIEADAGVNETYAVVQDEFGMASKVKLKITVKLNTPPEVVAPIENIVFNSSKEAPLQLDETLYFRDEDDEPLFYNFKIKNRKVANVIYKDGKFVITPKSYGITDITVTASDVMDTEASQTFSVLVRDGNYAVDLYPNPVKDILHIRTGSNTKAFVKIFSNNGSKVFSGEYDIKPFEPAQIDMSSFAGGKYTVSVNYEVNGKKKEVKSNIVKL